MEKNKQNQILDMLSQEYAYDENIDVINSNQENKNQDDTKKKNFLNKLFNKKKQDFDNISVLEEASDEMKEKMKERPVFYQEVYETNDPDVFLEVLHLRKQYNKKAKPAVNDISFKVRKGEFHAFIGANGAGKTTTIKSIVGAYAEFDGKIKICGIDNKLKESRKKLGYIPENARFPSKMSTYNYLKSMAELNGLTSKEAKEFTEKILKEFNMWNLKNVSPNKFSSGQKKKILLAQSLSNDPDILIMDEPTANLDPKSRISFFDILKDLQKQGKSIFISSHILSELDIYADSMTILDGGKIVFTGKREDAMSETMKYNYKIEVINKFENLNISPHMIIKEYPASEKKMYIISSDNKYTINDFINTLIEKNNFISIEKYHLSIEEMYKKFVIYGSVHTGGKTATIKPEK